MSRFTSTDKLFRQVLLKERPHVCEWCGKSNVVVQVAHILPKGSHPRLRYERTNILLLCFHCHICKAHKSPLEFHEWIESYKGPHLLESLRILERTLPKVDLKLISLCLKEEL